MCSKPRRVTVTLVLSLWWCCVELVSGHPRPSHCVGTGVPVGVLARTTIVPSDAQAGWHREETANPVLAVAVVLSSFANVFVILVFCDMLEYLHPCSTISAALRAHCRFQLSCCRALASLSARPPSRHSLLQSPWLLQRPGIVELFAAPPFVSVLLLLKRLLDGVHLVFQLGRFPLWLSSSYSASE